MTTAAPERTGGQAALRRLQLLVNRRLDGLLQGDYLGLLPGPGSEAGESREYRAGDDVRRMDWPVTARQANGLHRLDFRIPVEHHLVLLKIFRARIFRWIWLAQLWHRPKFAEGVAKFGIHPVYGFV